MQVFVDDKRFIHSSEKIKVTREKSKPTYCKYCYATRPTFVLVEHLQDGDLDMTQRLRCCSKCGAGLEIL